MFLLKLSGVPSSEMFMVFSMKSEKLGLDPGDEKMSCMKLIQKCIKNLLGTKWMDAVDRGLICIML